MPCGRIVSTPSCGAGWQDCRERWYSGNHISACFTPGFYSPRVRGTRPSSTYRPPNRRLTPAPGTRPGPGPGHTTETILPEQDPLSDSDRQKLRGRAAVIRAFMASYLGDVPAIIEHARQALEYLPKQDLTWRSTAAIALGDAQVSRVIWWQRTRPGWKRRRRAQRQAAPSFPSGLYEGGHNPEGAGPVAADNRDLPATDATCRQERIVARISGRLFVGDMGRGAG